MSEEIWKAINVSGFETAYEVSNYGRVRSIGRIVAFGKQKRFAPSKILNASSIQKKKINKVGYKSISLCFNGKTIRVPVHRLVALTFIDNPDNKPQVNHIDGNSFNNNVNNLEWVTCLENNRHAIKLGLTKLEEPSTVFCIYNILDGSIKKITGWNVLFKSLNISGIDFNVKGYYFKNNYVIYKETESIRVLALIKSDLIREGKNKPVICTSKDGNITRYKSLKATGKDKATLSKWLKNNKPNRNGEIWSYEG